MLILGVDPGRRNTGWAILSDTMVLYDGTIRDAYPREAIPAVLQRTHEAIGLRVIHAIAMELGNHDPLIDGEAETLLKEECDRLGITLGVFAPMPLSTRREGLTSLDSRHAKDAASVARQM